MVALATGVHVIALEKKEADALAEATSEVAKYYDIPALAPETIAWGNLIQTLAFVYGTRIIAANAQRKARRAEAARAAQPTAENSKGSATPSPNAPKAPNIVPLKGDIPSHHRVHIEGLGEIDVQTQP